MAPQYQPLTLENLNKGAVSELFEEAWQKLCEDIGNAEKPATKPRSVVIEITVIPNEERGFGNVDISVTPKLPKPKPLSSSGIAHFALEGDQVASYVNNPTQNVLGFQEPGKQEQGANN